MALSVLPAMDEPLRSNALDRLLAATHADMERVNAMILARADSHVAMVPELARYLIESGGKRLRPMLTVAAAALFGEARGNQINFAAAVEFMHNATLLHDDVVDESDMRRGKPAARKVWGNQASVLVGDFLLGQAFMMMVETRDIDALGVLSSAAAIIAEGEVFQLSKAGDFSTTPDEYDQVIRAKTATLFEAAAEVGAMAGGADMAGRQAMRIYGMELGRAFQLVDDVLDYRGESGAMGKNTGDDLREGKMTLPVILALGEATPEEREIIVTALGDEEAGAETLGGVLAVLNHYRTLDRTIAMADGYGRSAREALQALPASETRTLLSDIVEFTIARAY
jgi:octaprenyl-diphosphate synthase